MLETSFWSWLKTYHADDLLPPARKCIPLERGGLFRGTVALPNPAAPDLVGPPL